MKKLLTVLFVLLTNLFSPAQSMEVKSRLIPDPTSFQSLSWERKDCKRFEDGVGCTQAILYFSRLANVNSSGPLIIIINFPNGERLQYHPNLCRSVGSGELCKQVSWRFAPFVKGEGGKVK